jgi:hypothetical protein
MEASMKPEGIFTALGNFMKQLALIEIGILSLVGLICWWAGWLTVAGYASCLVGTGFAIMLLAVLSSSGQKPIGDARYNFAATFSRTSTDDYAKSIMPYRDGYLSFAAIAGLSGLITVVIGLIIGSGILR